MDIPRRLWRFPTREAVASLVFRFDFDLRLAGEDPESTLRDPERIDEFVAAYEHAPLTDDERFLLMAVVLNSFEVADVPPREHPLWARTLELLERDIATHVFTVLCFSMGGADWQVTPDLRAIAAKHRAAFGLS